jgi:hypothetical protein
MKPACVGQQPVAIQPFDRGAFMRPNRVQRRVFLFVFACAVELQMSPGLVAAGSGAGHRESKTLTVTKDCVPRR